MIKCPECGGENVIDGMLDSYGSLTFVKKGTENKLRPQSYRVIGKACTDCGALFDLRIRTTGKNKVGQDSTQ